MIEIRTERLVLKKLNQNNIQTLVFEIGNWEVAKWLTRVPYPYTENDAEDWLEMITRQEFNLNIFDRNVLVGGIGLEIDDDDYYKFGYWLGRQYWGKGYATEAGKGLLDYAMKRLNLKNIKASHMKGNDASGKVLKKLGFKSIGIDEVYCLARKEPIACLNLVLA